MKFKSINGSIGIVVCSLLLSGCSSEEPLGENELRIADASNSYEGEDYEDVIARLEDNGFYNIETETIDDLITGWLTKDGEVESISVGGEMEFDDGDIFTKDATVIITYHTFKDSGSNEAGDSIENESSSNDAINFDGYTLIEVYGGDLSGDRKPNAVVDVGFGEREYWAFTNEYGQLVKVIADEIILQDDSSEPVNSDGRYYDDEAKVPGTESPDLDEGHVIADSLGGVSNAYNITPQDSTLNRYGDQAYMEKVIRDAGGCTDFVAVITYPNKDTQTPSHYSFTYTLNGNVINDEFDNVNPEATDAATSAESPTRVDASTSTNTPTNTETPTVTTPDPVEEQPAPLATNHSDELYEIDANHNGTVTISEAKAAGYSMPIYSDFWLYDYMIDRDGDGMVGE